MGKAEEDSSLAARRRAVDSLLRNARHFVDSRGDQHVVHLFGVFKRFSHVLSPTFL